MIYFYLIYTIQTYFILNSFLISRSHLSNYNSFKYETVTPKATQFTYPRKKPYPSRAAQRQLNTSRTRLFFYLLAPPKPFPQTQASIRNLLNRKKMRNFNKFYRLWKNLWVCSQKRASRWKPWRRSKRSIWNRSKRLTSLSKCSRNRKNTSNEKS